MDAWEWNKLAAAVVGALAFLMAVHFIADAVFSPPSPAVSVYVPAYGPADGAGGGDGASADQAET